MPIQRGARAVARALRDAPLRISLSGIRMPLLVLIIITISRVHQYFGLLAKVRPALLLFVWAGAMLLLGDRKASAVSWKELPARLMMGLGAAAILSSFFGISFGGSAAYIVDTYWKIIVTALMIAAAVRTEDDLWTMIWAYVIAIGILSWLTITVYQMETANASGFARLGEGYSYDANDIGLVCVTGLPLCLVTLRTSRRMGKIASLVILALTCVAIARTGSRGAFLGIIAVAVSLLLMARSIGVGKRVAIAIVGATALLAAAPAGYLKQMGTITDLTQDYNFTSSTGRVEVAKRGLGYLKRNPVTGIGIANFPRAEGQLSVLAQDFEVGGAGVKWSTAHNSFLQAVVEMGLVGGGLFLALIWAGIASGRRLRRRLAESSAPPGARTLLMSSVAEYLPIAFIGFSVSGFFLSFAYADPVYILAAFTAGALALARRMESASSPPTHGRTPRRRT